ncbi:MAG: helix-turn-helix transcriptional regulator [Clostridia bacterium]|nr:helix-turn-helix transcriptional regulator [Clostridia bacterium]
MNNYRFGNYLCDLREKKNLSQKQLGMQLGISNKTISKWENGGGYPSTELVLPLAKALGVGVEELYAAISNDKQEKSKLRRMIDAVVGKSFLVVFIFSALTVLLWALFLVFGNSEDKIRISVISFFISAIVYFFLRFGFRMIVKNPIAPSKYVDILFVFLTACFALGFLMLVITYFFDFPNMFSPSFACVVAAFAGMSKSLKKRI